MCLIPVSNCQCQTVKPCTHGFATMSTTSEVILLGASDACYHFHVLTTLQFSLSSSFSYLPQPLLESSR